MGVGKDYEMHLVNGLSEATSDDVWVTRPDFSGNSKHAFADVAMIFPSVTDEIRDGEVKGVFIEAKKRKADGGKRSTVMAGSAKGQNGLEELQDLLTSTPRWGTSWIAVKFTRRELILVTAEWLQWALMQDDIPAEEAGPETGQPHLTDGGNVSMRKPTLDEHPSATAGTDDVEKILETVC